MLGSPTAPQTVRLWQVRPRHKPTHADFTLERLGPDMYASPAPPGYTGHPPLLVGRDVFPDRESAVARTQELLHEEIARHRQALAKLERIVIE